MKMYSFEYENKIYSIVRSSNKWEIFDNKERIKNQKDLVRKILRERYNDYTVTISSIPNTHMAIRRLYKYVVNKKLDTKELSILFSKLKNKLIKKSKYLTYQYSRNHEVKRVVIEKANKKCNCCHKIIGSNIIENIPELQCHHIKPLAHGGDDHPDNCEALCPNCHRAKHINLKLNDEDE